MSLGKYIKYKQLSYFNILNIFFDCLHKDNESKALFRKFLILFYYSLCKMYSNKLIIRLTIKLVIIIKIYLTFILFLKHNSLIKLISYKIK